MEVWQPVFNEYMQTEEGEDTLIELEEEFLNDLTAEYCKMYEDNLEFEQSDEFAKDTIEANDYEFTKDGNRF